MSDLTVIHVVEYKKWKEGYGPERAQTSDNGSIPCI